jgi:50S ribosomal subunit-associated GTPase HflX
MQNMGLDDLRQAIIERYENRLRGMSLLLEYDKAPLLAQIRKNALVVSEKYEEDGIHLELRIWPERREPLMQILGMQAESTP